MATQNNGEVRRNILAVLGQTGWTTGERRGGSGATSLQSGDHLLLPVTLLIILSLEHTIAD